MLLQLRYKSTFTNPVKTLEGNFTFEEGMTGITGRNGNGKSFILEMIQYALFGTEALRGKAEDYAVLEVTLDFMLKGRTLRVNRTKSKASLKELTGVADGQTITLDLASGTKPVNLKIEELFGYSSDVFCVANICNQGTVEELGKMKPTERKRLVDETIGLTVLDEVTAFIDGKRKDLNTGISAVEGVLKAPVEPQSPELLHDSATYKAMRDDLRTGIDSRNSWRAVAQRPLREPEAPSKPYDDDQYEAYQAQQQERSRLLTEFTVLDRELKSIPTYEGILVEKLHERDGEYDELVVRRRRAERIQTEIDINVRGLKAYQWEEPVLEWDQIKVYQARHVLADRWKMKQALLAKNVPHDCPKCGYHWEDQDPRVEAEFGDVTELPDTGSKILLEKEIKNREAYEKALPIQKHIESLRNDLAPLMVEETVRLINEIENTRRMYQASQKARDDNKRRADLETRTQALAVQFESIPDRSERLKLVESYRRLLVQYEVQKQAYDVAAKEKKDAEERLEYFRASLDQEYEDTDKNYILALNYENNLAHYKTAKLGYDLAVAQLDSLKAELLEWTNARQAVVDLRAKVKGYLLPSLNTVASLLINQMTGGELSMINIDEAFNITVDGQRLETLSGAGKAVANLAIRIGLGQVLTNRVFSVVMLDEIDASCDDERASYIAQCMKNLTKTIKQVIQVSHKSGLVADHNVRL